MIVLFNSTIRQGDCNFVEEFVDFERRRNNERPNVEQRCLDVLLSCMSRRERERILQGQDRAVTCDQDSLLTAILWWNAVVVCRMTARIFQASDSCAVIGLSVSSSIDRKTMECFSLNVNAFFYAYSSKRMSRITCSSFFGMASHHVHIDSYDQNILIGDQQPRRALIHMFHPSCSALGQMSSFSFISLFPLLEVRVLSPERWLRKG